MDNKLTAEIQQWLNTPADKRDIQAGALMMLKLNHNRILFQNAMRRPDKFASKIEYELNKFLKMRLNSITVEEVAELEKEVEAIVVPLIEKANFDENGEPQFEGKRADHDELPDEIKAIYVEQATIMHEMRDLHAKLRLKSTPEYKPCDRYQDVDLLKHTAKKYLANWETYDHYDASAAPIAEEKNVVVDAEPEKATKKGGKKAKSAKK